MGGSQSNTNGIYIPYISDVFSPPKKPVSYTLNSYADGPTTQTITQIANSPWKIVNTPSPVKQVIMNNITSDIPIGSFIVLLTNGMLYYSTSLSPLNLVKITTPVPVVQVIQLSATFFETMKGYSDMKGLLLIVGQDGKLYYNTLKTVNSTSWSPITVPSSVVFFAENTSTIAGFYLAYIDNTGILYSTNNNPNSQYTFTSCMWKSWQIVEPTNPPTKIIPLFFFTSAINMCFIIDTSYNMWRMTAFPSSYIITLVPNKTYEGTLTSPSTVKINIKQLIDVNNIGDVIAGKPKFALVTKEGDIAYSEAYTYFTRVPQTIISGVSNCFYFKSYGYVAPLITGNIAVLPNVSSEVSKNQAWSNTLVGLTSPIKQILYSDVYILVCEDGSVYTTPTIEPLTLTRVPILTNVIVSFMATGSKFNNSYFYIEKTTNYLYFSLKLNSGWIMMSANASAIYYNYVWFNDLRGGEVTVLYTIISNNTISTCNRKGSPYTFTPYIAKNQSGQNILVSRIFQHTLGFGIIDTSGNMWLPPTSTSISANNINIYIQFLSIRNVISVTTLSVNRNDYFAILSNGKLYFSNLSVITAGVYDIMPSISLYITSLLESRYVVDENYPLICIATNGSVSNSIARLSASDESSATLNITLASSISLFGKMNDLSKTCGGGKLLILILILVILYLFCLKKNKTRR